jgi:CBS domain-containing protein
MRDAVKRALLPFSVVFVDLHATIFAIGSVNCELLRRSCEGALLTAAAVYTKKERLMNVKSLLSHKGYKVFSIGPDAPLSECISVMNEKRVGALMVTGADGEILGLVSERDILRSAYARQCQICDIPVKQIMTVSDKLITATERDTLEEVMERMTNNRVRHIPVVEGRKLVGMVSIGDVVKSLLDATVEENQQMKDYISGRYVQP